MFGDLDMKTFMVRPRQRGFTLMELMIVLIVTSIGLTYTFEYEARKANTDEATALGNQLSEYVSAVDAYLEKAGPGVSNGNYNGSGWLKAQADCGNNAAYTGSSTFIGCTFPDTFFFHLTPQVAITNSGSIVTANITLGPIKLGNKLDLRLSSVAINRASTNNTTVPLFTNQYSFNKATGTMLVQVQGSQVGASTPWLLRDGSLPMTGNLNMGGNNIDNTGAVNANTVNGTTLNSTTLNSTNINGSNEALSQSLTVGNNALIDNSGNIFTNGSVVAQQNVAGKAVVATGMTLLNGTHPRMAEGVYDKQVFTPNSFWGGANSFAVTKPTCPSPLAPKVYTAIQSISSQNGTGIAGYRLQVYNNGGSWEVQPWVNELSYGWKPTPYAQILVTTKCG